MLVKLKQHIATFYLHVRIFRFPKFVMFAIQKATPY
jgi:hypothetical protein